MKTYYDEAIVVEAVYEPAMGTGGRETCLTAELWGKIHRFAVAIGAALLEKVLILYNALRDPDTPGWAKAVIVSALAYFVSPFDAVPDFIPGVGYVDDAGVIVAALAAVMRSVKDVHVLSAQRMLRVRRA